MSRARLVNQEGEEHEWRSHLLPHYRRSSPEVEQRQKNLGEKRIVYLYLDAICSKAQSVGKVYPTSAPL